MPYIPSHGAGKSYLWDPASSHLSIPSEFQPQKPLLLATSTVINPCTSQLVTLPCTYCVTTWGPQVILEVPPPILVHDPGSLALFLLLTHDFHPSDQQTIFSWTTAAAPWLDLPVFRLHPLLGAQ